MDQTLSDEIKNKKRFLYSYRNNKERLNKLEEKLETLEERLTSISSPNLSGMPRGSVLVTTADLIADKSILKDRIKTLKNKCDNIKKKVLAEIDLLEDVRYSEVLELYFISALSFDDIAEELGYSTRHTITLYSKAIKILVNNNNIAVETQ